MLFSQHFEEKLITTWFTDREEALAINTMTSKFIYVVNGLSQGSTFGPTLFIIYILRFYEHLQYCSGQFCADNKQLCNYRNKN